MGKQSNTAVVPRLRFPEFPDTVRWTRTTLRSIADPVTSRAQPSEANQVLTLSGEHGIVLQREFFGKIVAGANSERYIKVIKDDFVYNDRETIQCVFGTIKRVSSQAGGVVSPIYKCFRFDSNQEPLFWEFYFESGIHDAELRKLVNEGARTGRFNISIDKFLSTSAWRPDRAEQQKIAGCLTSLDEVISAQKRKVQLLKTYKRSLIQQLFPCEGENRPRLRFPEFRDAPEWETTQLGKVCSLRAGKFVAASEIAFDQEPDTYPCFGGNGLRGYTKTYTHSGRHSLIGRQGALCGNVILVDGPFHATEHALVSTPKAGYNADWLFHALCFLDLNRFAVGQAQPGLSVDVLEKVECTAPRSEVEQQAIANCLSSLDTKVEAESYRFDALMDQKKGLLQKLFPSAEET